VRNAYNILTGNFRNTQFIVVGMYTK